MSEFHSLANLIKRLEVATTRLEDLAMSSSSASAVAAAAPPPSPKAIGSAPTAAAAGNEVPAIVEKQDAALNEHFAKYYSLSQELGEPVSAQVKLLNCHFFFFFFAYLTFFYSIGCFNQGSSSSSKRYSLYFYIISKA
jgi:adenylyl cyclase-associated protein